MEHIDDVQMFHLRRRHNNITLPSGGYAVAVKPRKDGKYNVTISQCNEKQRYDEKLGEKVATTRMKQGKYFVSDWPSLVNTLNLLHDKIATGKRTALHLEQPE